MSMLVRRSLFCIILVVIESRWRSKGYGTLALKAICDMGRVWLHVWEGNERILF